MNHCTTVSHPLCFNLNYFGYVRIFNVNCAQYFLMLYTTTCVISTSYINYTNVSLQVARCRGHCFPASRFTHSDGWPSKGQAEQHQQRDDLMVGVNVRQAQAPVVAVETRLNRLEDVRPLQEVEADHGGDQDGQLWMGRERGGEEEWVCGEELIKPQRTEIPNE